MKNIFCLLIEAVIYDLIQNVVRKGKQKIREDYYARGEGKQLDYKRTS